MDKPSLNAEIGTNGSFMDGHYMRFQPQRFAAETLERLV
jgi:hypothetical protein